MHRLKPFDAFGGHPILLARSFRHNGPILACSRSKNPPNRAVDCESGFLRADS